MITGDYFKYIGNSRPAGTSVVQPSCRALLGLLAKRVADPFSRISGLSVQVLPFPLRGVRKGEDPPPSPGHPACAKFAASVYCRESWQFHLAALEHHPRSHWRTCDCGLRCAVVPMVPDGRCRAVLQLACPDNMPEDAFEELVEVLDVLVREFVAREGELLFRLLPAEHETETPTAAPASSANGATEVPPNHRKVTDALERIENRLSDPKLSVSGLARELGIHSDYLANLFAKQVGQRMSCYIAARRVQRAKNLLELTDWQIKRIAHECGFAHPNWFYRVFRDRAGLTPGEYRRASHRA